MDIQYIKTNIAKMTQHELTSLLADMILDNVIRIENFNPSKVYRFGSRVYFGENGTHYAWECIENNVTGPFDKTKWIPLIEVYKGPAPTFYTLRILEEVHFITEATKTNYTVKLDYNAEQTSVAIYRGMQRLCNGVDYTIDNKKIITFKIPMTVGERIIIEARERLGVVPNVIAGIVLYDINNEPYNVIIDDNGRVTVNKINKKDDVRDIKRATLVLGDKRYTLMVDSGLNPPALGLFEEVKEYIKTTDGKIYSVSVTGNKMTVIHEPYIEDGREYIMGTDKKFYKFNVTNGTLTASLYTNAALKTSDHNVGLRLKSTDYRDKMIDVVNGTVRLIDYLPNTAYRNIMFRDIATKKTWRMTLTHDLYLQIHDDTIGTGTHSPVTDYWYFYDYDLNNFKLYVENDRLKMETCPETVVRDSRGINMINDNGVLSKFIVTAGDKPDTILFADLSKGGTFASPLEDGLVVMDGNTKKIINVNINGDTMQIENAPVDSTFKTNDHYIFGSDDKLYKLTYTNGSVGVAICDPNDFVVENKRAKVVIRCRDGINIVDVKNGAINITPVSTFTHTLKSNNGQKFLLDINGDRGRETISFVQITSGHPYNNTNLGNLYLKNTSGSYYKGSINNSSLEFTSTTEDPLIDYNVTPIANSTKGWFKLELVGTTLGIRKIFNNMYYPSMSYEVVRDFVMSTDETKKRFSMSPDGNGELVIAPVEDKGIKGVFLRSTDDRCYCLGVVNNALTTYRSFVEKSVEIPKAIYIRDVISGRFIQLYMKEDKLYMEIVPMVPSTAVNELKVYNEYNDEFHVIARDGQLVLVGDILDRVVDASGKTYKGRIEKRRLQFTESPAAPTSTVGVVKLKDMITDVYYNFKVANGRLVGETTSEQHKSPTQAIRTEQGMYILSLFDGRISMTQLNNDGLPKEGSRFMSFIALTPDNTTGENNKDDEYVPIQLQSRKVYDDIRVYEGIVNSEGYVMFNMFDVDEEGNLNATDQESNSFAYTIPTETTARPKIRLLSEDDIKFE